MRSLSSRQLVALLWCLIIGFVPAPVAALSLAGLAQSAMSKIRPAATFFSNFSKSLISALKNTEYDDRSFMIYTPPATGAASDGSTSYGVGYDFGFRDGGDVQLPFGFNFDALGRYNYTPMTAMLYPGVIPDFTDPTGQKKIPLSLGDGVAPELIKGLLSLFVGGQSNAEKIWSPIGYFTIVQPETMFFLKVVTLLNSARKNTGKSGAYPALSDVPFELMILLFRLVISPDIPATVKLNNGYGPTQANRWSKVVTLSRPSKLVGNMPGFFVDILNSFKPSIDSREIQEYKDRFGAPTSQLQQIYAQGRMTHPYETRLDFVKNQIVDGMDVKTLNPTDVDLWNYAIRQVISERFRGLKTYIESTTIQSNMVTDDSGTTDSSATAMTDDTLLISIDVSRIMDFMSARQPKIKEFIAYLQTAEKQSLLSADLKKYLDAIGKTIDLEFSDLKQMVDDLTNARQALADARAQQGGAFLPSDPTQLLEQAVSQRILDKLDAIEAQEAGELAAATGNKVAVPLLAYMDIKFWQTMRTMQQSFTGDKNYLFDDSRLSLAKALVQAYAICFRANLDLQYIENLIKTDSRSFVLQDQAGNQQTVTGQKLYKDYTDAERYLIYCQQKVSTYKASLNGMAPDQIQKDPQLAQFTKDADNAAVLYGKARQAFRYSLRQFGCDRRLPRAKSVGIVMLGNTSMAGLGDVNVISVPGAEAPAAAPATSSASASSSSTATAPTVKAATSGTGSAAGSASTSATASAGASAQGSATLSVSLGKTSQGAGSAPAAVDNPMAVFGNLGVSLSGTAAGSGGVSGSASGNASGSASASGDASLEVPNLDNPFSSISASSDGAQTPQEQFLGIDPTKPGYARTVNDFLKQEFARLMLRCPNFETFAEANFDRMAYQMTGMHITDLMKQAAGEASDIQKQSDAGFLPDGAFFTNPKPSGAIVAGASAVDMNALGKELAARYGLDSSSEMDDSSNDASSTDSDASGSSGGLDWGSSDASQDDGSTVFNLDLSGSAFADQDAAVSQSSATSISNNAPQDTAPDAQPANLSSEDVSSSADQGDVNSSDPSQAGMDYAGNSTMGGYDPGMVDQSYVDPSAFDQASMNQMANEAAYAAQGNGGYAWDPNAAQYQYQNQAPYQNQMMYPQQTPGVDQTQFAGAMQNGGMAYQQPVMYQQPMMAQ